MNLQYNLNLNHLLEHISVKEGNAHFHEFQQHNNLNNIQNVILIGDHSTFNACLIGRYMIEDYTRLPARTILISCLNNSSIFYTRNTLVIVCGSSESILGIESTLQLLKNDKIVTLIISNASELMPCATINTNLIIESGISENPNITSVLIILSLITLIIGRYKTISLIEGREIVSNLYSLPTKMEALFKQAYHISNISRKIQSSRFIGFAANRYNYAIAQEGATLFNSKYGVFSSVLHASEMKHGPISLVDEGSPFIVILCEDNLLHKTISNVMELLARKAHVILITNLTNNIINGLAHDVIKIPNCAELFTPLISLKTIEMLAHYSSIKN
jgi:glutamine---fructose-6-phosphate transaminase (isomerizing)